MALLNRPYCVPAYALLALLLTAGDAIAHPPHATEAGPASRRAAQQWLASLDGPLRKQAEFAFDGPERTDWHFIPKHRVGVSLKVMDVTQRRAAHRMLRAVLSNQGYLKATAIMHLEQILRELESERPLVEQIRDQENYWFAVFGDPGGDAPWGWRVEGHHLSLNFSSLTGQVIASTPAFFGANPAEVRTGPQAGLRVLGAEEDLARDLMAAFDAEQRARAIIQAEAPRDVITGPGKSLDVGKPAGVAWSEMNAAQRALLRQLIEEYLHNLERDLAEPELTKMEGAGWDTIHFAWAGSLERGAGHYYRVHGPTFLIEYDNTQNDANHVHTVWHSLDNDFGRDALRKHYAESPHHQGENK